MLIRIRSGPQAAARPAARESVGSRRARRRGLAAAALTSCAVAGLACGPSVRRPPVIVTEQPVPPPPTGAEPTPPSEAPEPERRDVRQEKEAVIVAAWAEPPHLPPGGGQAQILIRVQRRGGAPAAGVEVRIETTEGSLFSRGRILTTDQGGRTRDRITTNRTARVEINAGGTRYSILIPVLPRQAHPE